MRATRGRVVEAEAVVAGAGAVTAGFIAALTGIGGGVIMVPLFMASLGLGFNKAATLSLLAIAANATISSSRYVDEGLVDPRLAPPLAVGAVIGGPLGSLVASHVEERALEAVFSAVLAVTVYRLLKRALAPDGSPQAREAEAAGRHAGAAVAGLVGLTAGFLAGLLGVGGGVVAVPLMILLLGMEPKTAAATSSLLVAMSASAAFSARIGLVDGLWYAPATAVAASLGSYAGSRVMVRAGSRTVSLILAAVLAVAAARMALKAVGGGLG